MLLWFYWIVLSNIFSWNTVISDGFRKQYICYFIIPFFQMFFKFYFHYQLKMMILMALVLLKIFFVKLNCVLFRIKINQKSRFSVLKAHILTVHTFCYICINVIFLTSFLIMNYLSFIWKLINDKFLSNIFVY